MATYPIFEDVYGNRESNTVDDLVKEVSKFHGLDLLVYLGRVNITLSDGFFSKDERERRLILDLFNENDAAKVEKLRQVRERFITPFHLRALTKIALLNCNFDSKNAEKTVRSNPEEIGKLFLRVASQLGKEYKNKKRSIGDTANQRKLLLLNITRSLEVLKQYHPGFLIARYWIFYNRCVPRAKDKWSSEYYDFASKFEEISGIPVSDFMILGLILCSYYLGETFASKQFVFNHQSSHNLQDRTQSLLFKMYDVISTNDASFKTELRKNDIENPSFWYDFTSFWRKPLYRLSPIEIFPLDPKYLLEKFTAGTYWMVKDSLYQNEKSNHHRFVGFFGRVFETYCDDLLQRIYPSSPLLAKRYWSQLKDEETGNIDGIVFSHPGTLFLFEFTAQAIPLVSVFAQDWEVLEEEINKLLFGEKGGEGRSPSIGKIGQLDKAISLFSEEKINLGSVNSKDICTIIPIVVFQKKPPYLKEFWEEFYLNRTLGRVENKEVFKNLQFFDIEELELIEALIEKKGWTLEGLLKKKLESGNWFNPFNIFASLELPKEWPENTELSNEVEKIVRKSPNYFKKSIEN